MKLFLISLLTFFILFTACASPDNMVAEAMVEETVPAIPIAEIVKKADALFAQRADSAKLREAINTIRQARNPAQRNFEVEWKFAKYSYFYGRQEKDLKAGAEALNDGYEAGKIASRLEPAKPEGYFWMGACLGEQSRRNPLTVGMSSIDELRGLMNKVIEIQPDYQNASAFDALAQIELNTRLAGGSPEKAIEYLKKALELDKENSYIYLHLAEAYLYVDKKTEAKKQIDYILNMKPTADYEPEYQEVAGQAKKLLETKFK